MSEILKKDGWTKASTRSYTISIMSAIELARSRAEVPLMSSETWHAEMYGYLPRRRKWLPMM
jgi:hypothetical protein